MRWVLWFGAITIVLVATAIWILLPPGKLPSIYSLEDCRRVQIINPVNNSALAGIEDIALSPDGRLILSAYDRHADAAVSGGLYSVSLFGLTGGDTVRARLVSNSIAPGEVFRPHGMSISTTGSRLAVINRFAPGEARIEIGSLTQDGWQIDRRVAGERLCRANDLFLISGRRDEMTITLDRGDCTTSLRDLKPGATTGKLGWFDGTHFEITRVRMAFPNGIAGPYVAETRENRILRPGASPIALPGAPDNLNLDADEKLIAAVHPKLVQLWLYKERIIDVAPTRILRIDPKTASIDVLFDDPSGAIFSGATSAVYVDDMVVAGSVQDEGLLVCRKAP